MTTTSLLISGALGAVVLLIAVTVLLGREAAERATVTINNDTVLAVRVADNPWEQRRGLSGLEAEDVEAQGMLFVFPESRIQEFWMKDMRLALDIIWIKDGRVVSVDRNVPAPAKGEDPARASSDPVPVDMVLEIPAGYAQLFDIQPGTTLKIELP